jgi:hypothetical protein
MGSEIISVIDRRQRWRAQERLKILVEAVRLAHP